MRPRLLDLFCCEGGAGTGYHQAGFDVVGVDIAPQPRYPFEFHQDDAMTFPLDGFDAVHASPPCQDHSAAMQFGLADHGTADLLPATLERLKAWGGPWIVENVEGADMPGALVLCGSEFGLGAVGQGKYRTLRRHRKFLSNVLLMGAGGCTCAGRLVGGVYGRGEQGKNGGRGYGFAADAARDAMGMPWASRDGARQAIPPAYARFLGEQLMAHLEQRVLPLGEIGGA